MTVSALLVLLPAVPLFGLAVLYLAPERLAALIGAATGAVVLVLSLVLLPLFDYAHPGTMQGQVDWSWVPALGLRFHLGVDGVSLPLLIMTTLLTALCLGYELRGSARAAGERHGRSFTALVLLLEIGMVGTFLAEDLLLFFLFFEVVLLPMYGLILGWGTGDRRRAATKFILYTLLGSALMLTGFVLIYAKTGTFDMVTLDRTHGAGLTAGVQAAAFALVGLGFAIKTPMWPLHTWLPDAHTSAPTTGSVLLAGVLLKMGTYGFIRIGLGMVPLGAHRFALALGAFGAVGIVYGALACLAQVRRGGDFKRLVAYSSVGHMGFVLLGIATLTRVGVDGALFASVAHGLITGLLFFLAGGFKDRLGSTDLHGIGRGLYARAPRYGVLLAFAAIASLGLPGLAGFWGEVYVLIGADSPADGLSTVGFRILMGVAGSGMVLTAGYLLLVVRRLCMSPAGPEIEDVPEHAVHPDVEPETEPVAGAETGAAGAVLGGWDLTGHEMAGWLPLAALTLLAGLWPALILGVADPAVHSLLGGLR
jgi:NADH-quinone oxidoreductase subunit M